MADRGALTRPRTLAHLLNSDLPGLNPEISAWDDMCRSPDKVERYLQTGRRALACIELAQMLAGKPPPETILDLPSGHGRVLRFLRAAFPNAEITACDVQADAVAFCRKAFGALPAVAPADPGELRSDRTFDLIWCGSLFTHMPLKRCRALLRFFAGSLAPDGLLVFTASGRRMAALLDRRPQLLGIPSDQLDRLKRDFVESGFAYQDYPAGTVASVVASEPGKADDVAVLERDYGASLASPGSMLVLLDELDLVLTLLLGGSWGGQDVYACVHGSELERDPRLLTRTWERWFRDREGREPRDP